jgi:hypothetical protein
MRPATTTAKTSAKPRKSRLRHLRWLALLLLPLPSMVGYAGSGDPIRTMSEISNSAAKGDRLPIAHSPGAARITCAPMRQRGDLSVCPDIAAAN